MVPDTGGEIRSDVNDPDGSLLPVGAHAEDPPSGLCDGGEQWDLPPTPFSSSPPPSPLSPRSLGCPEATFFIDMSRGDLCCSMGGWRCSDGGRVPLC